MLMEAALCTIPLFGLGILIGAMVPYSTIETGGLALAFSAGLYEELVFRLLLIEAGAHVSITFLGMSRTNAMPYLIGLSGVLFACYHAPLLEGFDVTGLMVYTFGGIWLAVLYRYRGLAIAVLTHVFYDILVLAQ
ncbi:MAG: CPBP family intramembrane glutamic endopeptidase [Planctomycetota bacterium]|nr:CPBP family intramembrane glutamic endopeptidase [Planctomycetota bacterium]